MTTSGPERRLQCGLAWARFLIRFLGYVGDLEFGVIADGLDVDGDHILLVVLLIVGDDGAVILVGTCRPGIGKLGFVEVADLVYGVAGFELCGDGMDGSEGHGRRAVFLDFGSGVDIDAEIFGGLHGIVGADRAEGSFDFHVVTFLVNLGVLGDTVGEEADAGYAEDSDEDDHGDDDQNNFDGATAAGRRWNWRAGHDRGRRGPRYR